MVVTGDALYCQRALCQQIRAAKAHYLFQVKANQPTLLADLALLIAEPPPGACFAEATQCQPKRHGRRETRHLRASTALGGYLDWPDVRQVVQVTSQVERADGLTMQVRYFITSLPPRVGARALLLVVRGHWGIENRLHYVRDVTLSEDASQVRAGAAPQALAALRNTVLALLRLHGWTNMAAALRQCAWTPGAALHMLGLVPT
jgi:predicted transposase YbfD/YdcC